MIWHFQDWLKEDHCSPGPNNDTDKMYLDTLTKMSQCLNATGRPIFFDLCAHGCYDIIDGVDQVMNVALDIDTVCVCVVRVMLTPVLNTAGFPRRPRLAVENTENCLIPFHLGVHAEAQR